MISRAAHLRELLERLTPHDATEREHQRRMLTLLERAADPFDRANYAPGHVTASAFIVDPDREQILLILHEKLARWLQPGGHVDAQDPDVIAAARREVQEETGLVNLPLAAAGILDVDIHAIPARDPAPAHEHFDVRFVFEAPRESGRAGSDARAVRWVGVAELLAQGSRAELPTDESVLRAVRKLRTRLA
jgi:8-oxo-dGTP pyrophosphatase MutT (NUDIX family)